MTLNSRLPNLHIKVRPPSSNPVGASLDQRSLISLSSMFPTMKYTRATHWQLGALNATIEVEGRAAILAQLMSIAIGQRLYENSGNTWQGTITKARYDIGHEQYTVNMTDVHNAVRAKYEVYEPDTSRNILRNGGFVYGSDVSNASPQHWDRFNSESKVSRQFTTYRTGSAALELLQRVSVANNCYQVTRVTEAKLHRLTFWAYGDGTSGAAKYKIQNAKTQADIVSETDSGVTAATWTQVNVDFVVPDGCTEISIIFINHASGDSWVDDVELSEYKNIEYTTGFYEDPASIGRYGRYEKEIEANATNETAAIREAEAYLAAHAHPVPQTTLIDLYATHETEAKLTLTAEGALIANHRRIEIPALNVTTATTDPTAMGNDTDESLATNRDTETATVSEIIRHAIKYGIFELEVGAITANDTTTTMPRGNALRILKAMVEIPDSSGRRYRYIVRQGQISYEPIPELPVHTRNHLGLQEKTGAKVVDIWNVKPGIWRTISNAITFQKPPNAWPPGTYDTLVAEIHASTDGTIRSAPQDTTDFFTALEN